MRRAVRFKLEFGSVLRHGEYLCKGWTNELLLLLFFKCDIDVQVSSQTWGSASFFAHMFFTHALVREHNWQMTLEELGELKVQVPTQLYINLDQWKSI